MLNAIVWIAKVEVPDGGVASKTPTIEDLKENQDYETRGNYDYGRIEKLIQQWNR